MISKANNVLAPAKKYDIAASQKEKVNLLIEYVELKNEELLLLQKMCETENADSIMPELRRVRTVAYNRFAEAVAK